MPVKDLPTDPAERMALGKKLHEKTEWPDIASAAKALRVHGSSLYAIQREYRLANGLPLAAPRGKAVKKTKPEANGHNGQLTVMPTQDNSIQLRRIAELEDELHHAHDHIETLQKLLMTVGKALP